MDSVHLFDIAPNVQFSHDISRVLNDLSRLISVQKFGFNFDYDEKLEFFFCKMRHPCSRVTNNILCLNSLFHFLQVYYLRQGHELYVKEVMATKCYEINPKKQCFYKLRLKVMNLTNVNVVCIP